MRFEWDEVKNRSNQRKHGISFEDAAYIFADPFYLSTRERIEDGEERWQTLGRVRGSLVVMVAHLLLEQESEITIRIISARGANRQERRRYEEEDR